MMSDKIWRATGEFRKKKRTFSFDVELMADKEEHVREKIYSEIGSRHKVKRRELTFDKIVELKPEEVTDLELRKILGLESEFE